jgi:hypothetical protein
VATYAAPPPWEVRDIPLFKFRWDARAWAARNRLFRQKWRVRYDPRSKRAAYRRQYLKLGLARWYPAKWTVGMANASVTTIRVMRSIASRVIGEKRPRVQGR